MIEVNWFIIKLILSKGESPFHWGGIRHSSVGAEEALEGIARGGVDGDGILALG